MRNNVSLKFATLFAIFISITACEKANQNGGTNHEKESNFFIYDGYTFDIKSVVSYDAGDNLLEFWLSSTEGLKTAEEVESAGDYVVLNTHKSYLGGRDRFSGASSNNSSIRFCNEKFAKGDVGNAYIEVAIEGDILTLDFIAENLYTKAAAPVPVKLKGTYKGTYSVEDEEKYSNEWGLDRERNKITEAILNNYEKGMSVISLNSADGNGIDIQLDPSRINNKITFPTKKDISDITITYGNDTNFRLTDAIGSISVSSDSENIRVEVDLKTREGRLRAYYNGAHETKLYKKNRYIFDYEGDSSVEGWHDIVKLMVQHSGSQVKFYFSPSTGYSINNSNSTHMPILTVPESIINKGKTFVKDLDGWNINYDTMQASKYENEDKPHAGEEDWIEITENGNIYTVELEISSSSTYMPSSSLDIYYSGTASN